MMCSTKYVIERSMFLELLVEEEKAMKTTLTFLERYCSVLKTFADLKDRVSELSNARQKEILDAVSPLVEAEMRTCEESEKKLEEDECVAHEKEVDYIARRLLSANEFSQDVNRFSRGLEADSKDWREDFHLKYHRQREIVFCLRRALEHFMGNFEGRLEASCKNYITRLVEDAGKNIEPLMMTLQNDLEKSQTPSLDMDESGNLKSPPKIPDNHGAFCVGKMDMDIGGDNQCSLPILVDNDKLNVITYQYPKGSTDSTACDNCRALLENLLEQILMFSLPDTTVNIYDGDALLSGFDGLLKDLRVQVGEKQVPIIYHYAKFDETKILALSSEFTVDKGVDFGAARKRTVYAFVLVPEDIEDREVTRYKTIIEDAISQGKYGFHLVLIGQTNAIKKFGDWDVRKCVCNQLDFQPRGRISYANGECRIDGLSHIVSWSAEDEKRQRVRTMLNGLAIPPTPISREAIALRIAHVPQSDKEFNVILDKEHSGTTFIEGEPGAGKSILLTQMLLTAVEKYDNRRVQFYLMDLKGGLTFSKFDSTKQVKYVLSVKGEDDADVVRAFIELVRSENKRRMSLFKAAGVQNLDEYNALAIERSQMEKMLPRLIVVIDECRPLFTTNATQKEGRQTLDTALKELLRTGRALGVHFIFTSQNKGDLPSDYHDLFEHYFLLRKAPYRVRHYERVHDAKDDHDEYRRGVLLEPYFIGSGDVDATLNQHHNEYGEADTISLDAGTYQTLKGYPGFENELKLCQYRALEKDPDRLVLALGTSLAAVDHLHVVEFSPRKDKPNLLIVGQAEVASTTVDVEARLPPRDACINLMLQSLRLSPLDVQVAVVDPNKRIAALPAIADASVRKPRYVTDEAECRAVVRQWVKQGGESVNAGEGLKPFVLFVIDAQTNWLFKEVNHECNAQVVEVPRVSRRADWLTKGVGESISERQKQEVPNENWNDMLFKSLMDGQRNQAYLILVSDSPGMVEENFSMLKHFTTLSRFRVVHFNYSGERLSQLPRSFDNRSETNGSLFESGEYENRLASRFLPFEPFSIEPQKEQQK